ncbi:MAG: potassium transporter Kup [Alphaproteobacteria bacterium]
MPREAKNHFSKLTLGAIGIVYGDLGTSPLYALKVCFKATNDTSPLAVLGILSLIFWTIMLVVSLKYVVLIMRADNNGEGGILALMALALRNATPSLRKKIMLAGILGTALFFGESVITPAISVLSALEGLKVAAPIFTPYVVPLAIIILIGLFLFQSLGTGSIARLFGPVMVVWFLYIGLLGFAQIVHEPFVLHSFNPYYAVHFLIKHQSEALGVLGAVFLAITGAEVLYTDMGHFGKKPIGYAWFSLALPCLLLNYFGQGALVLSNPEAIQNPFYYLVPSWGLYPTVLLAIFAAIIASQAVISGTFSLGRQAVQLGYLPRLKIMHTSAQKIGQVYIPQINRWLMFFVVLLVLEFQTSSALASAYGVAVSGIMVLTTLLTFFVARHVWGWGFAKITLIFGGFLLIDSVFFVANLLKVFDGGWIPLAIAMGIYTIMSTWKEGRSILLNQIQRSSVKITKFIENLKEHPLLRVPGTAIFMSSSRKMAPYSLLVNTKYNKILHERIVLLSIVTKDIPCVPRSQRVEIEDLGENFYRITASYGFQQTPDVARVLEQVTQMGLTFNISETTFFLSRGMPMRAMRIHISRWREKLFIYLTRNAASATEFFTIPHQRVVELRIPFKV